MDLENLVGKWASYELYSQDGQRLPVQLLKIVVIRKEAYLGRLCFWVGLQIEKANGRNIIVRLLVDGDPFTLDAHDSVNVYRYLLQEGNERPIEYLDRSSGEPIMPKYGLRTNLIPIAAVDTSYVEGFFTKGKYLGLPLLLREVGDGVAPTIEEPDIVTIDTDLFIGTHRHFRDVGRGEAGGAQEVVSLLSDRIWTGEDYEYVPYGADDIEELIDAGFNYFCINEQQEEWIRRKPVFYYSRGELDYPIALYRSNFRGVGGFVDEPAMHLSGYLMQNIGKYLNVSAQDVARLMEQWSYEACFKGKYNLQRKIVEAGIPVGDMVLVDEDQFIYDTSYSSSCYQTKVTGKPVVLEARFWLRDIHLLNVLYGTDIPCTRENLIRFYYAFLRGATRPFGSRWGIGVYGQMEVDFQVPSMQLAYDMGANYVFFWSSDRLHHMTYKEQVALARWLRTYSNTCQRKEPDQRARVAIALPYGYMLQLGPMWYCPAFHLERRNEAGSTYRDVLRSAVLQVEKCSRENVPYDIIIDEEPFTQSEYDEVIRIREDGSIKGPRETKYVLFNTEGKLVNGRSEKLLSVKIVTQPSSGVVPLLVALACEVSVKGKKLILGQDLSTSKIEVMWEVERSDGSVVNYWDGRIVYDLDDFRKWKDMQKSSDYRITQEFDKQGVYTVRAYAWDGDGNVAIGSATIHVFGQEDSDSA